MFIVLCHHAPRHVTPCYFGFTSVGSFVFIGLPKTLVVEHLYVKNKKIPEQIFSNTRRSSPWPRQSTTYCDEVLLRVYLAYS